ncbi:MAG: hypothetical protein JWP47_640 [Polaromonas sp.]|nr:hypothetical protein [Polaromonas sp.]
MLKKLKLQCSAATGQRQADHSWRPAQNCKPAPTQDAACILHIAAPTKPSLWLYLGENIMPVIAWILGVPLSVVLILMLFGVF